MSFHCRFPSCSHIEFSTLQELEEHTLTHHFIIAEQPVSVCRNCKRSFSQIKDAIAHGLLHTESSDNSIMSMETMLEQNVPEESAQSSPLPSPSPSILQEMTERGSSSRSSTNPSNSNEGSFSNKTDSSSLETDSDGIKRRVESSPDSVGSEWAHRRVLLDRRRLKEP